MASNYNRKSASSGSRKQPARGRGAAPSGSRSSARSAPPRAQGRPSNAKGSRSSGSKTPVRSSQPASYQAIPGGRYTPSRRPSQPQQRLTSVRVGDLDRADRASRAQGRYRRYIVRLIAIASVLSALIIGGIVLYNSNAFAIENVTVTGVEHLTSAEMETMANVPAGTTLLRVDATGIRESLMKNSWVKDAEVKRVFPNTLELVVTERTIAAVVKVPTEDARTTKDWAIASDHMWLMPIPAQDSEQGKKTSAKIYEDVASVLTITDVPYGTKAAIGTFSSDENVNNALDIISGLTTELAGRVTQVSAAEPEETKLVLDNEVTIAFGKAQDIRDKERVCLKIMEENPNVVYINVRVVDSPTWRSL